MAPAPRRPPSLRGSAQRDQVRQRGDDTVAHRITVGRGYAPDTPPTAGRGYAPDSSHNRGMHDRTQGPRIGGSTRDPDSRRRGRSPDLRGLVASSSGPWQRHLVTPFGDHPGALHASHGRPVAVTAAVAPTARSTGGG